MSQVSAEFIPTRIAILTVSDRRGEEDDTSGHWLRRQDGLLLALQKQDWIARLYALFDFACERQGVFHLWAHSTQIEQLEAWGAFDALLGHIAAHVPARNRVSNAQLATRSFTVALESPVGSF